MHISGAEIALRKQKLRKQARARRREAQARRGAAAAKAIISHGLAFFNTRSPGVVAGYYPVGSELSPLGLMAALEAAGWRGALPVVAAKDAGLEFYAWRQGDKLVKGAHDIPRPAAEAERLVPDIVITPLLSFDRRGYRLGYGGGYYDRTLQFLRSEGPLTAIGLAFAAQMVDEVPHASFDQKLDLVLVEDGLITCGAKGSGL